MGKSHLETLKEEYLTNQAIIAKYQEANCGLTTDGLALLRVMYPAVDQAYQRLEAVECKITALLGARTKSD